MNATLSTHRRVWGGLRSGRLLRRPDQRLDRYVLVGAVVSTWLILIGAAILLATSPERAFPAGMMPKKPIYDEWWARTDAPSAPALAPRVDAAVLSDRIG